MLTSSASQVASKNIGLYAHLMRRGGFSATRVELETMATRRYEDVVEELLHPEQFRDVEADMLLRYTNPPGLDRVAGGWLWRMIASGKTLTERMALFWHQLFPTASSKSHAFVQEQIEMFRRVGLSDLRSILVAVSKDPAMLMWLDNNENNKNEPNENYGRELLELFSMGVGNYTEDDVKGATRAFTGWTFATPIPGGSTREGGYPTEFVYDEFQHDDGTKSFLGQRGQLDGEDVIDAIVGQPATARFVSRHMYNFFVADEPPVAAWNEIPPQDPKAIDILVESYFDSEADVRAMLRALFNSNFFKAAQFKKVKGPVELVTGMIKLVDEKRRPFPERAFGRHDGVTGLMGQSLMNPLTVEGWHTGKDWIDGGTLMERINFAADHVGDPNRPGTRDIVERLAAQGDSVGPESFVDTCLDLAGPLSAGDQTRKALLDHANEGGDLRFDSDEAREESAKRVARMLTLIVAAPEYQFA